MAVRARKTKRTPAKKAAPKKNSSRTATTNEKIHQETFKNIEKQIEETWDKLCQHVYKRDSKALLKDATRMKVLLGECQYMANEFERCRSQLKRKKR